MSFKLLTISFLYSGFLDSFYKKNPAVKNLTYNEQLERILYETSEPIGTYTKAFNSLGIEAGCIITNANYLQKKWRIENKVNSIRGRLQVVEQVKKFSPDVLWVEGNEFIEKDWIELVRKVVPSVRLIIGNHCAPYNSKMIGNFRNLDLMFTCTPGLRDVLEKNNIKVFLIYHAFDSEILRKINEDDFLPENGFIFSGSLYKGGGFHDKRIQFLENILSSDIDLKIYANLEKKIKTRAKQAIYWFFRLLTILKIEKNISNIKIFRDIEIYRNNKVSDDSMVLRKAVHTPYFGIDMFRLLKKSKIVLNIHGDVAGEYAGNVRLFETTGVGSCLLTDNKKNLSELFEIGKEIMVYDDINDCVEKAKWLLTHDEERSKIAMAGQRRTLTSHTVRERCKTIIEIINSELRNKPGRI